MPQFIRLEKSKQFLNLDHVSLVSEQGDGTVIVGIIDRESDEVIGGNDAMNLLARLKMDVKGRR
jgi:hypothetical protein